MELLGEANTDSKLHKMNYNLIYSIVFTPTCTRHSHAKMHVWIFIPTHTHTDMHTHTMGRNSVT